MKYAEIKEKMTQGEWQLVHRTVIEKPVRIQEHFAIAPEGGPTMAFLPDGRIDIQESNAHAIVTAVNNTYGKGIDPETVPELLKQLKALVGQIQASNYLVVPPGPLDAITKAEGNEIIS